MKKILLLIVILTSISILSIADTFNRKNTFNLLSAEEIKNKNETDYEYICGKLVKKIIMPIEGTYSLKKNYTKENIKEKPIITAFVLSVYIPHPEYIENISLKITQKRTNNSIWYRSSDNLQKNIGQNIVPGWNTFRWKAVESNVQDWDYLEQVEIIFKGSEPGIVFFNELYAEVSDKAKMIIVVDGLRRSFLDYLEKDPTLTKVPITWAIAFGNLNGSEKDTFPIESLSKRINNGDSISFHSSEYAKKKRTAEMTENEILYDTKMGLAILNQLGIETKWRAAWLQNTAPNHSAAQEFLMAYATPKSSASIDIWPPQSPWNIPRVSIHNRSKEIIDDFFNKLKKTRSFMVWYTHGIGTGSKYDTTEEDWYYFINKVKKGISDGWLEVDTFEGFLKKYGWYNPDDFFYDIRTH